MSDKPKSEELQELADLCAPTAEALKRIAGYYRTGVSSSNNNVRQAFEVAQWLHPDAANAFARNASSARVSEAAEKELRREIAGHIGSIDGVDAVPAEVVERIVSRVRNRNGD